MTVQALIIAANCGLIALAILIGLVVRRWEWPMNFVGQLTGAVLCLVAIVNLWRML